VLAGNVSGYAGFADDPTVRSDGAGTYHMGGNRLSLSIEGAGNAGTPAINTKLMTKE
jgi:hypothetical protein